MVLVVFSEDSIAFLILRSSSIITPFRIGLNDISWTLPPYVPITVYNNLLFSLLGSTGAQALPKARVSLEGDAEVASGFWQLLRAARPDAEEELSRVVGDVLAHDIGKTVNSLDKYGRRVLSAFQMNTTEYLQEEVKQLPPRVEIDGFFSSLERLRDDIERTGIRINRLEAKLGQ